MADVDQQLLQLADEEAVHVGGTGLSEVECSMQEAEVSGRASTQRGRQVPVALAATSVVSLLLVGMLSLGWVLKIQRPRAQFQAEEPLAAFTQLATMSEHRITEENVNLTKSVRLYEKFSSESSTVDDIVTCVTQTCDCTWATGGPLGFCSTIGCPCPNRKCWDCCCKNLFPEEYRYAMGMRSFPPLPWWWPILITFLIILICGSCFVIVFYCLDIYKDRQ
jgi:hypothetical protein